MKRIFKYPLKADDRQVIAIPKGSKVLSVIEQHEQIVLYALVEDSELAHTDLKVIIHGTGHPAYDVSDFEFVGSVKLCHGTLVFHVFCDRLEVD